MTHEVEGSHALISAQLARRYGETQGVVHAIEAHHYEVQPQTVEAVLLIAADAISASRPGARGESLENYIKRLESLEELAASRPGVEKVYALQAGREIRVIVKPEEVDDDTAVLLSHEIAREIEDHLEYPGQIKVTVIRESRATDVASNRLDVVARRPRTSTPRNVRCASSARQRCPGRCRSSPSRSASPCAGGEMRRRSSPPRARTASRSRSRAATNSRPRTKTCDHDGAAAGSTNWGRKARKKSAVFGLRTFTTIPCANRRRKRSPARLASPATSRSSSLRMPT